MIDYSCMICGDENDLSTYFIGEGKCTSCWNLFKKVGSWRGVKRKRSNKLRSDS
tara:strand:- start:181 stop:342 length:162 start_codon:yes stop_codon:yes gene_type:complete